jgi:hypothetical protein
MALIHNTNSIVTQNLVLCLDAANIKSYSGSGATTWSDLSGNGNNGTLTGNPTYSSLYSGSIVFDGSSQYGTVSNNITPGTGDFAVSIWVYKTEIVANRYVWDFGSNGAVLASGTSDGPGFRYYNPTIGLGSPLYTSGPIHNINTWYNIVISRISGITYFYSNGSLIISAADAGNIGSWGTTLTIGGYGGGAGYYTQGNISNFLVYKNKGLTAAEVSQNYNALKSRYLIQYIDPYYPQVSLLLRNSFTASTTRYTGSPLDESPTPKTITQSGSANISSTIFKYGTGALSFNGTGGVSAEYNSDLDLAGNDFTIEAWVRLNSYLVGGTGATIVDRYTSTSRSYYFNIYYSSYQGRYYLYFSWTTNNSTDLIAYAAIPTPNLSIFSHYSVVRSGSQILFFVDGVNCPLSGQSALGTFYNQPTPLNIGSANTLTGFNALNGYIDDLRITKGVARYTANFTPPTSELSANIANDTNYNNVSLLLRNGSPILGYIHIDESPVAKPLTFSGGAGFITSVFKYGGGALSFNGTGGVSAEYNSDLDLAGNDFTIEAWVRLNSYLVGGTGATIVDRYTSTSRSYYFNIYYSSYQGRYYLYFSWTTNNSTDLIAYAAIPTPNLSIFSHYSVVRSGSQILFFVDGVNCPLSGQSALGTFYNQPTPLNIGSANTLTGFNALNGYIDDLRITKGVARYTANFTPPTTESSTGYYKI